MNTAMLTQLPELIVHEESVVSSTSPPAATRVVDTAHGTVTIPAVPKRIASLG